MPDSEPQPCVNGFAQTFKQQLKSVGGRFVKDVKSVAFSPKGDFNVFSTALLIGTTAMVAPWLFTAAGIASVAGAALGEQGETVPETEACPEAAPEAEPAPEMEACPEAVPV